MFFSLRTNRRRVTANRHMAIAAGGLQECVHHTFGLPMRHRRTEFGMQPSKFACGCIEQVLLLWRRVPYRIRAASAPLPSFPAIEDFAERGLEFGAVAVVQTSKKAAARTSPTRSADPLELLIHKLLLHAVAEGLAFGKRQSNVYSCIEGCSVVSVRQSAHIESLKNTRATTVLLFVEDMYWSLVFYPGDVVRYFALNSAPGSANNDLAQDLNENVAPLIRLLEVMCQMEITGIVLFTSSGGIVHRKLCRLPNYIPWIS